MRPELEDVERLGDIWRNRVKWSEFKTWLREKCEVEGEDSEGQVLSVERYAAFLELFVSLHSEFKRDCRGDNCLNSFLALANHKEKFFSVDRCLKCIDLEIRESVIRDIKSVRRGEMSPSPVIFAQVYKKVFDKLLELLGSYQNHLLSSSNKIS